MLEQQIYEYTGETGARDIGGKKDAETILHETVTLYLTMHFSLSPCWRINQFFVLTLWIFKKIFK